jgi:hypothetical protein
VGHDQLFATYLDFDADRLRREVVEVFLAYRRGGASAFAVLTEQREVVVAEDVAGRRTRAGPR